MGLVTCALWKRAAVSASAALETTCLIVLHSVRIGPFGVAVQVGEALLLRKKCPAKRLRAQGNTR